MKRVAAFLGALLFLSGSAAAQATRDTTFYMERERRVSITIALNQIGFLSHPGAPANDLRRLADLFHLTPVDTVRQDYLIYGLQHPVSRRAINQLARRVRGRGQGVIDQAGIVVRRTGWDAPMLVTDQFLVRVPRERGSAIDSLNAIHHVRNLGENPLAPGEFLLSVIDSSATDAIEQANAYENTGSLGARFAHPNFLLPVIPRQVHPNDILFADQWHHDNPLAGPNGPLDADIDTPLAWELTKGSPDVVIAVIDGGFDMSHPDLMANFWTASTGEHGWDFSGCDDDMSSGCGDRDPSFDPFLSWTYHGTATAGLAAAVGFNHLGVIGVCPQCHLMLLRRQYSTYGMAQAFRYAALHGASVISCSWGLSPGTSVPTDLRDAIDDAAVHGRGELGIPIVFAMSDLDQDDCALAVPDISALDNVIAVSGSDNEDRKSPETARGACMEVLGPAHGGTFNVVTTDIHTAAGYNTAVPLSTPCPTSEEEDVDYTKCFTGTSAAAPIVAGVAGLLLSETPTLTKDRVQRLIEDTADKVEPEAALYDPTTGFSRVGEGSTHGFGRVNAFEAVRTASPRPGGAPKPDLFLRDNDLDWGNTEQPSDKKFNATRDFIPYWSSVDVKVDAGPDPLWQPEPKTSKEFDALTDEEPRAGADNRIYVRVRNRGSGAESAANVRACWARYGAAMPTLPSDFWDAYPGKFSATSEWNWIDPPASFDLPYCGSSQARDAVVDGKPEDDHAKIARLDFHAPVVNPNEPNHFCFFVTVDSDADHPGPRFRTLAGQTPLGPADFSVDVLTPTDNNIAQRNVQLLDASGPYESVNQFYVRNSTRTAAEFTLNAQAPPGWKVTFKGVPINLGPGQRALARAVITRIPRQAGTVFISQVRAGGHARGTSIGGLQVKFTPFK